MTGHSQTSPRHKSEEYDQFVGEVHSDGVEETNEDSLKSEGLRVSTDFKVPEKN